MNDRNGSDRLSKDHDRHSEAPVDVTSHKVVPLRLQKLSRMPEALDPRLEELRRILSQAEPADGEYSDDEVIRDEGKFRRRFGPGFRWNRRDRIGLVELKERYDLTDSEIKLFQHTGNLRRTAFGVRLVGSPWLALWGWVQIGYLALLFLALVLAAWPNLAATPAKGIKLAIASLVLFGFCMCSYWLYVKPWVLKRRKERDNRLRAG